MGIFPEHRLVTSACSRRCAARRTLRNEKLPIPIPNDVVRILGLTKENQFEKAANSCHSLWKMPYEKQLQFKKDRMLGQLKRLSEIIQNNVILPIIDEKTKLFRSLTVYPIVPSPKITGYRQKDGYIIDFGVDGDPTTVGLAYGSGRLVVSVPPEFHIVAKPIHAIVAKLFQAYLRHPSTPADVNSQTHSDGGYNYITTRSSRLSDKIMLVAHFRKDGFTAERIDEEARRLVDYFLDKTFAELPAGSRISSIFLQRVHKHFCHADEAPFEHLGGDEFFEETLLDRTFRISPQSFFQINVDCAELLFRTVVDHCQLDMDTVLLDLGCGAGVYSIVLADYVKRAIGIDLNQRCIADAYQNARLNAVSNAEFIRGRLETAPREFMATMTKPGEKLVAVVNPGRWGLLGESVQALRRFKELRTLIYVSCYPYSSAFTNFVNLLSLPNENYEGEPFQLVKAIPVDMFPQTPHYELILLFQR